MDRGATLLDAASAAGVHVPTLCHLVGSAEPSISCMVCVVRVAGRGPLVPACATPAEEDQAVFTDDEGIRSARRSAIELLLSDHLGECQAPCELACPTHWDVPGFMDALREDRTDLAAQISHDGLALPAVLGEICPAPCQKACRRGERDAPVRIRELHGHVGRMEVATARPEDPGQARGYIPKEDPGQARGYMEDTPAVAVVGAGAAGLAAAGRLAGRGAAVTVFFAGPVPGGSLRAQAELSAEALEADLRSLERWRVQWRPGSRLGEDLSLEGLLSDFAAVVLATGDRLDSEAWTAMGLGIDDAGRLAVDRPSRQTSRPGVFAAGACAGRGGLAVRVVADGLAAAEAVLQHLAGEPVTGPARARNVRYGPLEEDERAQLWAQAGDSGAGPDEAVVDAASAIAAANRCLLCGCEGHDACRLRQLATELGARVSGFAGQRRPWARDASHGALVFEGHKCILCGSCIGRSDGGLAFAGRGFTARVATPYDQPWATALARTDGSLADACPTRAIRRKRPGPPEGPESP